MNFEFMNLMPFRDPVKLSMVKATGDEIVRDQHVSAARAVDSSAMLSAVTYPCLPLG